MADSGDASLPVFGFLSRHRQPLVDGLAQEAEWLARAADSGRAVAHLWRGTTGLVVPRSYERESGFAHACAQAALHGWPVQVRASGGGLVPQGPGVLNLSLVWRTAQVQPHGTDAVYRGLCAGLAAAFARLGIAAHAAEVPGSFCDGRFNLAVAGPEGPAKLVGTAQAWRRVNGQPTVLAHALMLVQADPVQLTQACNAFEAALGSARRYRESAVTSVAQAWTQAHGTAAPPDDLDDLLEQALAETFAHIVPPREALAA